MTDDSALKELRSRLDVCLGQLSRLDIHLLRTDETEAAIAHRLAVYLGQHFDGWDVDCGYAAGRRAYPDIIVHHRGTNENLLAVDIEKSSHPSSAGIARARLEAYKTDPELEFRYACLARIRVGEEPGERVTYELI